MSIIFTKRDYFQTPLFNTISNSYLSSVFTSLVKKFSLVSAKGSSGAKFKESQLGEAIRIQTDMPYHIHILNGLFPALKLFEQKLQERYLINNKEIESFVKSLFIGFTFHDINKLVGSELREAVDIEIERLCKTIKVQSFFPEWKDWLTENQVLSITYREPFCSLCISTIN